MRTPWNLARTAADALAADAKTQAFATTRYGAPLTVYLADTGTAADMPPLPHVLVELDGAGDGGTGAPTIDFALSLRVPAWIDPMTGERRDPSKPAMTPGGFYECGDGPGATALIRICAGAVADALEEFGAYLESTRYEYGIGRPSGDTAAASLSFRLAVGLYGELDGETDPAIVHPSN